MENLFRQNPIALALAVVAALLAAVIVAEAAIGFWPRAIDEAPKAASASDAKMLPPVPTVVADSAYPETAARPLFTPTRRPAPAAPAGAGNMVKGQFVLTGVIAVGDQRTALLKEKTNGKVHRVDRGKEVNGMTLSSVDPEKVTLTQGGDEEVLTLQVSKAAGVPGQPGQPGAAPPATLVMPTGPFGPVAGGQPAVPVAAPVAAPPVGAPAAGQAAPNPAGRFGPFPQNPAPAPEAATPMTPEELLARRRARRGQQQPNQ